MCRSRFVRGRILRSLVALSLLVVLTPSADATEFVGKVADAKTGQPLPARVYLQDSAGKWLFVKSAVKDGTALAYREQWVPMANSVEKHTTVSAHPFRAELPPGKYTVTIERGKEYFPLKVQLSVGDEPLRKTLRLRRWINLAKRGWYSGETHVHRRIQELPNVMLAEDLNVAFPVTFWTTNAYQAPGLAPSPLRRQGPSPFGRREDRGHRAIAVDKTHVIYPRNTEYEVFSVNKKRHTLGAVFILNHKTVFQEGMPPVAKIAEQAHREGALLDLDKHSWPWSMMLVPIAKIDLFELSNNSVWRTRFGFRRSATKPAPYMDVEMKDGAMTEWGWISFGLQNYYTLLNCGFRIQPTAGTASGVHPVPLGHSRVYVHTGTEFSGKKWLDGLRRGHSFVTTGPMLFATLEGATSGHEFRADGKSGESNKYKLRIESISSRPLDRIEVLVNGRITKTFKTPHTATPNEASRVVHSTTLPITKSSWVAVRSFERQPDGRIRFAHTAPWHIRVKDQPVRPRREEIEFLTRRVQDEIDRNKDVLSPAAMAEFRKALKIYKSLKTQGE